MKKQLASSFTSNYNSDEEMATNGYFTYASRSARKTERSSDL